MSIRTLVNPNARETLDGPSPDRAPLRLHRRLPGYEETPLVDAPGLAGALGVGKVFVKNESSRLGLPSFKILGASWAVCRALEEHLGDEGFGDWEEIEDLKEGSRPCDRSRSWRPRMAITGAQWRGLRGYLASGRRSSCPRTWSLRAARQ